jgi:hypothetical protein
MVNLVDKNLDCAWPAVGSPMEHDFALAGGGKAGWICMTVK